MCRHYEWVLVGNPTFLHQVLQLLPSAWECLSFGHTSQGQVLSWSRCLVLFLSGGGDGVCWCGLGCCVHFWRARAFLDTAVAGRRRPGNLPCSPKCGSVRKFGKRSSSCISGNEFQLKSRCCFSVQALYHCTVLLLVSWSLCGSQ